MSDFSSFTGKQLVKILKKAGFEVVRIRGSHHFLHHEDGHCTVIPIHRGETIGKGLLRKILNDIELDKEDLRKLI